MINCTLCYITRGDDVLMLHRVKKQNDINKDKWIGIGGKFEAEESPTSAFSGKQRKKRV
jgi:8-oxo-dGTP diphosphatase